MNTKVKNCKDQKQSNKNRAIEYPHHTLLIKSNIVRQSYKITTHTTNFSSYLYYNTKYSLKQIFTLACSCVVGSWLYLFRFSWRLVFAYAYLFGFGFRCVWVWCSCIYGVGLRVPLTSAWQMMCFDWVGCIHSRIGCVSLSNGYGLALWVVNTEVRRLACWLAWFSFGVKLEKGRFEYNRGKVINQGKMGNVREYLTMLEKST